MTVTFTSPNGDTQTTTFDINGFRTQKEEADAAILADKEKFKDFDQHLADTPDRIREGAPNWLVVNELILLGRRINLLLMTLDLLSKLCS